ncbi:hypothetical protein ACH4HG_34990 [Streptomyces coeruleorubidus]|uniref:hypothetical protein n=1 Tax=Streptomyces coeruleorubidus TaxID=116188 RepID=UPI0037B179FD
MAARPGGHRRVDHQLQDLPCRPVARLLVHPLDDRRTEGREAIGVHVGAEQPCIDVVNPLDIDELTERLVAAADAEGLDTFAVNGHSLGGPSRSPSGTSCSRPVRTDCSLST